MPSVELETYVDKLPCACSPGRPGRKAAAFNALLFDLKKDRAQDLVFSIYALNLHFQRFKESPVLRRILQEEGHGALPVTLINGEPFFKGRFPDRAELDEALDRVQKLLPGGKEMRPDGG